MEAVTELVLELKLHPEVSPDAKEALDQSKVQMNQYISFCLSAMIKTSSLCFSILCYYEVDV